MSDSNIRYLNIPEKAQRERLLEMLLSELDGMVYRCRVDDDWTMEFVSGGCETLTGYQPEELLFNSRISYEEITHPLDRSRVRQEILNAISKRRTFSIEYRICHADGKIRWVWERGSGVDDAGGHFIHGFIEDITQRHMHEEALAEAESRYRSIFENATEGIFQTTEDGAYLAVNPALASIYGYDSPKTLIDALQNIDQQLYVDKGRRQSFTELMKSNGKVQDFESRVYTRDGRIIWISENAHAVHGPYGNLLYYEGTVVDISSRKRFEKALSHQATHDSLTGLPNRLLLTDRIDHATQRVTGNDQLAVLFIDLDNFKNINDSLGHQSGDLLLKEAAQRLRDCVRHSDTVARLGGDEFVILLPDIERGSDAVQLTVQRILHAIQQPCQIEGKHYTVGCSIGISLFPEDGSDADTLLKFADMAMYKAKQSGRNTFHYFTATLNRSVLENLELEQRLRHALQADQFELHYQPLISLKDRKIIAAEALIRWHLPRQGVVMPGRFIPLAERTGLINALGGWVLNEVCRQQRVWLDEGLPVVPVAFNTSPSQFNHPDFVDTVRQALMTHDLDAALLKIEVTENCYAHDQKQFIKTLEQLMELGLTLAIDDFGTGYSNMQCLRTMTVESLKVDSSFIQAIHEDNNRAIYNAIIAMAHNLNFRVVAEGVETQEQVDFLIMAGCDDIQGYYFSMPLVATDFSGVLKAGESGL